MKKIKFASKNVHFTFPLVGKSVMPEWYKKEPVIKRGETMPLSIGGTPTSTFKRCVPVFDSMTSGYFAVLGQDIQITQQDGVAYIQWPTETAPLSLRDGTHFSQEAVPSGYSEKAWVWLSELIVKLPIGYSMIVCHPFNRYDLPFITLSAIVDADGTMHEGKFPFYLKEGYEGVLKKGTPIFQIVPFKRESWKSVLDSSVLKDADRNSYNAKSSFYGWYKKNIWKIKTFVDGANNEKN